MHKSITLTLLLLSFPLFSAEHLEVSKERAILEIKRGKRVAKVCPQGLYYQSADNENEFGLCTNIVDKQKECMTTHSILSVKIPCSEKIFIPPRLYLSLN